MKPVCHDLYAGFEGEPELIVQRRVGGVTRASVHAWIGHFDRLMASFLAPAEGWSGIARHYHLHTGWYEEDEWTDPSPEETCGILQVASGNTRDRAARALADALMQMCREVMSEGGEMVWRED